MAVISPAINTQRITGVSRQIGKGLTDAGKSIRNVTQLVFRNTKVKRDAFAQTKMIRDRRVEYERRKQLEDELESPDIVTKGGAGQLAQADTSKGLFGRLLGFLGYLTAGWLMKNLPQWIAWGKEFIGRVQRAGEIAGGFLKNMINIFTGTWNILGSVAQNIASFDFFDTSKRVRKAMDELNGTVGSMSNQIQEAFSLVTTPFSQQPEQPPPDAYEEQGPGVYATAGLSGEAQRRIGNDAAFLGEVKRISQKYGIKEGDLLGLIASESGFNPAAGEIGGHVGLIQFGVREAKSVGTTQAALKRMSRAEQMKYVDKYFETRKLKYGAGAGQLYSTVFAPAYASGDPNRVLYSSPSREYSSNAPLDTNRDGRITVAEMGGRIERKKKEFGISDNISFAERSPTSIQNQSGGGGKIVQYLHGDPSRPGYEPKGHWNHDHFSFTTRAAAVKAFLALREQGYQPYEFEGYTRVGKHSPTGGHFGPVGGKATYDDTTDGTAFDIPYSSYGSGKIGSKDYAKSLRAYQIVSAAIGGGVGGAEGLPPAQIASAPQQAPSSLTPSISGMDLLVNLAQQGEEYSAPAPSQPSTGGGMSQQVPESALLNNFIKNKLLLDLAYL
jgi:hypothetical protein